jgi:hypothetical protein
MATPDWSELFYPFEFEKKSKKSKKQKTEYVL